MTMATTTTYPTVSVIGAGAMGSALAKAFLANGYQVTVWNRTAKKCRALEEAGATVATSVAAAVTASRVIVVCVINYDVSDSLLRNKDVAGKPAGKLLVQLSSGTPREARDGEAWAKKAGVAYLDGAIMAYPKDVGSQECTILYSGRQKVFEAHKKLLLSLGGATVFVGDDIGSASTLDQSVLSFYYGSVIFFLHGAAICESEGFPISTYVSTLVPLLPVISDTMKTWEPMIQKGSYAGREASLNTGAAILGLIARTSRENGIDRALPEFLLGYVRKALAAGRGSEEGAALFEFLKKKRKRELGSRRK
jgi:3-hydroxyisobutyrate dehydrogenase-like beta-hydroxyacid dehydrogenase